MSSFYKPMTPYADQLDILLKSKNKKSSATPSGVSGETTRTMNDRLTLDLMAFKTPFDYVAVMAGTNDLGGEKKPAAIMENIEKLFKTIVDNEKKMIVMTVPQNGFADDESLKWLQENRDELNNLLREFANKNSLILVDVDKSIPYSKENGLWFDVSSSSSCCCC
jgi:lysophospholipase L1-like esterase